MKKISGLLFVSLLLVLLVTPIASGCTPQLQQTITLKWAEYGASNDERMVAYNQFIDRVKQESNGRIIIEMYDTEKLVKAMQMYDAVGEGTIDMCAFNIAYYAGKNPIVCLLSEAAAFEVGDSVVVASRMANTWDKYLQPHGIKYLGWGVEFNVLSFAGPRIFKIPTDLKGLKIRAPGGEVASVEQCGGKGVSVPTPEIYMSLQKGVIDATLSNMSNMKVLRIYEVVPALTMTRFGSAACPVVMNLNKWNSLPDEAKKIINKVSSEMPAWHYKWIMEQGNELETFLKGQFKETYKWTDQEDKAWRAIFAGAQVKRAVDKYGAEAQEIWNRVQTVLADVKSTKSQGKPPRFFD
jgi:TRAP-type C4-dicarboxylate transport system substrate-binding protein